MNKRAVLVYVCGPTVYGLAHIGNARPAVVFDCLRRVLEKKWRVRYVSNFTDIDDKIIQAAKEEGTGDLALATREIAERYEKEYLGDMAKLSVRPPDVRPRATQNMEEIKKMIGKLITKGNAYEAEGHVLFDVHSFKGKDGYGALSHRTLDEMKTGARVEVAPYKKSPYDFVLWKPSKESEAGVGWESPWGFGRPGWHIECSAMIEKTLGKEIDIHAAGGDLIFPHHENERAQSICALGGDFVKLWMHNGMVILDKGKMSKSIGNIVSVRDLLAEWDGYVLRLALLMTHYRSPLNWTDDLLKQAKAITARWQRAAVKVIPVRARPLEKNPVLEALADDLNTPQAITLLSGYAKQILGTDDPAQLAQLKAQFEEGLEMLGLGGLGFVEIWDANFKKKISELVEKRTAAKKRGDYKEADRIRNKLLGINVELEDEKDGTKWRFPHTR